MLAVRPKWSGHTARTGGRDIRAVCNLHKGGPTGTRSGELCILVSCNQLANNKLCQTADLARWLVVLDDDNSNNNEDEEQVVQLAGFLEQSVRRKSRPSRPVAAVPVCLLT